MIFEEVARRFQGRRQSGRELRCSLTRFASSSLSPRRRRPLLRTAAVSEGAAIGVTRPRVRVSLSLCRSGWCMSGDGVLDVRVLAQFVAQQHVLVF